MKQSIYKICLCSILVLLAACSDDESIWKEEGNSTIKLRFTDGIFSTYASRAEVNDTDMERAISHLDVFFFDVDGSSPAIHERVTNPSTEGEDEDGTVSLGVSLKTFENRPHNFVYVIANAKDDLSSINSLDDLKAAVQEDARIHVTGIPEISDAPQYFLMDGKASGPQDQSTPRGAVFINSNSMEDITLEVILKRAAAKVVVTLNEFVPSGDYTGDVYRFLQSDDNYEKGYYFRNMPYKTKILGGQEGNAAYPEWTSEDYLRMPDKANDSAFEWLPEGEKKVVVTAYVYSHKWRNEANDNYYARGTSLVVNIPMWKDEDKDGVLDAGETVYKNSYYQIPIVDKNEGNSIEALDDYWQIDRNTVYELTAAIKDPGAEDSKHPLELEIYYNTYEWNPKPINVAGDNVNYLEVNKEVLEMYNVEHDATLTFTSSSPVTVTLSDKAYYYNKYGRKIEFKATDFVSDPVWNTESLLGSIEVSSIKPENLTARYFNLTVTNKDNLSKTIKVIQYPVICVSNQLGYYSYREDFGFHWKSSRQNNARVSVGANNVKGTYDEEAASNERNYYGTSGSSSYFFSSKVIKSNPDETAASHASYFYNGKSERSNNACESSTNLRMYQMQIMATSDEYVVGKPRLNAKGYTDSSEENNRLVSPSFMIASRLGAVYSGAGGTNNLKNGGNGGLQYNANDRTFSKVNLEITQSPTWPDYITEYGTTAKDANYNVTNDELLKFYADHCKNYVEVVGDDNNQKVYSDWRLPTAAEIVFIINHQGAKGVDADAIDYLLNGAFYYSAMGPIYNPLRDISEAGKAIRCVHDVYESDLVISKKE